MLAFNGLQPALALVALAWPALDRLELFSHTVENRFIFNLFDLLLCGVIVLVVLRGWRPSPRPASTRNQLFLFLAFVSLGASFALGAVVDGALLFFRVRLAETPFDLLIHGFQASAWLLLAACIFRMPGRSQPNAEQSRGEFASFLLPLVSVAVLAAALAAWLPSAATTALDLTNLALLALVLILFYRRPLGGRHLATGALGFLLLAALLHLGSAWGQKMSTAVILWNLEQFTWLLSLFTLALAIGETRRDLFDKVFVRLQIAFILLASLMILVIIRTETTEYLQNIRSRSSQLAEFMHAHVEYFQQRNETLQATVESKDFLEQMTLGFGSLRELKIVRVHAGSQAATFGIADDGTIHRDLATDVPVPLLVPYDPDEYFLIHALPATGVGMSRVELYGTREFLHQHIRKRIVLIFSMFTGMVALSTLMIGAVVRGAGATIRRQAREIEEAQQRLMQASKLAAIGELASGVAHEINNPATTVLSRASFMLSQEGAHSSPSDREDLEAIVAQAQRISRITRGLLTFTRPHALEIKPISIGRVIETSLLSVQALLEARHITVEKNLWPDSPRVLVDEASLARALENIFRNAVDAMPQGGRLRIRTAREDSGGAQLRLEIADSGVGIAGDNLGRIFDPFFTTKEVGKGTGLGLSIAHGIIKEHHGTIAVESQPGVGTRFIIVLPTEH